MVHVNKNTDVHAQQLCSINQSHQAGVCTSMQTTRTSRYDGTAEEDLRYRYRKATRSHRKHAGELEKAYQMPLPSGQSLAIKAHVNNGETGLSNKKWS